MSCSFFVFNKKFNYDTHAYMQQCDIKRFSILIIHFKSGQILVLRILKEKIIKKCLWKL